MATIPYENIRTPLDGRMKLFRWAAMAEGDVGQAVPAGEFNDKTFRVAGTFAGGAAVIAEGSLIPEATDVGDYDQLVDPQGNPISFTLKGIETVLENVYLLRPRVVGGSGVDVTVHLLVR